MRFGFFRGRKCFSLFCRSRAGVSPHTCELTSTFLLVRVFAHSCTSMCELLLEKFADKACWAPPSILLPHPFIRLLADDGHCGKSGWASVSHLCLGWVVPCWAFPGKAPWEGVLCEPGVLPASGPQETCLQCRPVQEDSNLPRHPHLRFPLRIHRSRKENWKPALPGLWAADLE